MYGDTHSFDIAACIPNSAIAIAVAIIVVIVIIIIIIIIIITDIAVDNDTTVVVF